MTPDETIAALAGLLNEERERIARLWAKRLREELYELDLPGRDLRAPLRRLRPCGSWATMYPCSTTISAPMACRPLMC